MKTFLMILGGIFGVLILSAVGLLIFAYISSGGPELDLESKAWVDSVVPEIVSSWDENKFKENSNYRLLETTDNESILKLLSTLEDQFGDLKNYQGSEGQAGIRVNNGVKTITAEYIAHAEFETGMAQIEIQGIKEEDKWTILRFFVTPVKSEE
jgi:hypothetical protein